MTSYIKFGTGFRLGSGLLTRIPKPLNALDFVNLSDVLQYCRADVGITLNGENVTQWDDLSVNARHYTQLTPANQPTYQITGGPNSQAAIKLTSSPATSLRNSSFLLPAPGTTPTTIWSILRTETWGSAARMIAGDSPASHMLWNNSSSPNIGAFNETNILNSGAPVGTWARAEVYFSNSVSDYFRLNTTKVTGTNLGNRASAAGGRFIGDPEGWGAGASAAMGISEILYLSNELTAYQSLSLDNYAYERYSIGTPNSVPTGTALDAVASGKVLQYIRADLGVTKDGSNRVSEWKDQFAGLHYTQGTSESQPLFLATGGPNGTPAIQLDDAARKMLSTLDLPAPGTTPTYIWLVMRQDAWTDTKYIVTGGSANHMNLWQRNIGGGGSPDIRQYNGSHAHINSAATIGSWFRIDAYFSNTTSDRIQIGSTTVTGENAGNINPVANRALGDLASASALITVCDLMYLNELPSATEKTALDNYVTTRYGAGLV